MEEIVKLSKIVTLNLKPNSILPQLESVVKGKEKLLLSNIRAGVYSCEQDAAEDIYNSTPNDTRYKMLKSRLKKKLLDYLFFIDVSNSSQNDEIVCLDFLHHARVLILKGEYDISLRLLNKAHALAKENDFTDIIIDCLEYKSLYYMHKGLGKLLDENLNQLVELRNIKSYESQSVAIYQRARLNLTKSISSRTKYLTELGKIIVELELLWKETKTFITFENYYMLYVWYHELIGDFKKNIEITKESYKMLLEERINKKRFNERFNEYVLVYSLLREKDFHKGLKYAELFLENFNSDDHNWFAFMENYFLLAMHSRQYELAEVLIDKVFSNPSYSIVSRTAKERWNLFKTYLSFIAPVRGTFKEFNYQTFITSVPEYSKDKQGFNVAILILQFVHFLRKQDAEGLLYRIESLRKYMLVHLKNSYSLRSKIFLKLLMLTVTSDFDVEKCKSKGEKFLQKLVETPAPGDAYAEIEIIPYEHLWELILLILEKYKVK